MPDKQATYFSIVILLLSVGTLETRTIRHDWTIATVPGNPDGFPRPVISVSDGSLSEDRLFPGPLISAHKGDTLEINVFNDFDAEKTSLHFHGLHMYFNPWMDGAEGLTECGIEAKSNFTYRFDLTQTGTYWYHAHVGAQYGDGLLGAIIIDYPKDSDDPVKKAYPYERDVIMLLQDWFHEPWDNIVTAYVGPKHSFFPYQPIYPWPTTNVLINGKGQFNCKVDDCEWLRTQTFPECPEEDIPQCMPLREPFLGKCESPKPNDLEQHHCPHGKALRLRFINGAHNAPLRFWIDRHDLIVVAKDGFEVQPLTVKYLTLPVGQRVDAIVKCDKDSKHKYYMYVTLASAFLPVGAVIPNITAKALLSYGNESTIIEPTHNPIPIENPIYGDDVLFEYKLKPLEEVVAEPAVKRIVLPFHPVWDIKKGDPLEEWEVGGMTYAPPTAPLLQTLYFGEDLNSVVREYRGSVGNLLKTHIIHLEYNQVYEIVMLANETQQHPWHLHGHSIQYVAAGLFNNTDIVTNRKDQCGWPIKDVGQANLDAYLPPFDKTVSAISIGDSFTVPGWGYVAFRFKADNIGPWFFHCHVEWHLRVGMALVFSVEHNNKYSAIASPPDYYRGCGKMFQLDKTQEGLQKYKNFMYATIALGVTTFIAILAIISLIWKAYFKKEAFITPVQ